MIPRLAGMILLLDGGVQERWGKGWNMAYSIRMNSSPDDASELRYRQNTGETSVVELQRRVELARFAGAGIASPLSISAPDGQ
ncbi:MAG: hypothetical protein ACC642_08895, partial [Pseudomonadales bacterium]